jgi:hypothetical protein
MATYGSPLEFVNDKEAWEAKILVTRDLVTPLPYAYGPATITRIRAHKLVADLFVEFLAKAAELCVPDLTRIAYGGCYCWRAMRGSMKLSTHTWGIAIDLDPARNELGMAWDSSVGIPVPVIELADTMGLMCGLRWTRPDPQHFQYADGY